MTSRRQLNRYPSTSSTTAGRPRLRRETAASVSIAAAGSQPSVLVPISAIYQTGAAPSVWIVKDDTVRLRPVKLGAFGDGSVQVLEGLANNDVVITAGVHKLKDGQKVRLAGEKN